MQVFNPNDPNVAMLERVALCLGPELCSQLVFVGGAAAGLLITDLAMPAIRRTDDVDIVTNAEALADYYRFEDQLRGLGFVQDQSPETCLISDMYVPDFIKQAIATKPIGAVFSSADFLPAGSRAAIDQTLTRMMKAGIIVRVAGGLLSRP